VGRIDSVGIASKLVFALIFPGFFIYWHLVVSGWIPKFLGGYAPAISLLCAVILVSVALMKGLRVNWIDSALTIFLSVIVIIAFWHSGHGAPAAVVESYLSMVVQWVALYLLFRSVSFDDRWLVVLRVSLLIMLAFVVNYGIMGGFLLTGAGASSLGLPTYQDFGLYLAFSAMALMSLERNIAIRGVVFVLSLVSLVLLGSRSELMLYLVGAAIIAVVQTKKSHAAIIASVAAAAVYVGMLLVDEVETNRIAFWVSMIAQGEGLYQDPLRAAVNENGLRVIGNHPFLGAFAYYPPGEYAHNLLSLWAEFGVGLFLLYLVMFVGALVVFIQYRSSYPVGVSFGFALGLWVATALLLVVAKSFGYYVVPVLLGSASYLLSSQRLKAVTSRFAVSQERIKELSVGK